MIYHLADIQSDVEEGLAQSEEPLQQTTGFFSELWEKFLDYLPTLLVALVVFFIGLTLSKALIKIMRRSMQRANVNQTAAGFGQSLLQILLYTLLLTICLTILGVPMSSIVAIVGAAGLAIGLALQDSLSNLAGGFIILFAKPFQAGDYIILDNVEGFVQSVTILYTSLQTRDNKMVFIPNGTVSTGEIINLSQCGTLKVSIPLSIAYDANIEQARRVLLDAVDTDERFLKDPAPSVSMNGHGDNAVILSLNVTVRFEDYFGAPAILYEIAKQALDRAKIEIPYPQIVMHTQNG